MDKPADTMEKNSAGMGVSNKVLAEILILAGILGLIGFFMQDKVDKLLSASVEQSVARQTADFSVLAEERFQRELSELRYAAHYMENHSSRDSAQAFAASQPMAGQEPERRAEDTAGEIDEQKAIEAFRNLESMGREGVSCGIFNRFFGALQGEALSHQDFPLLIRAFSGNAIVDYCAGKGLLFAVPVMNGDNVRYVLYRLYSEAVLYDYFGLEEYDADSRILIRERNGTVIVPYRGFGEKDEAFFRDPTIQADFDRIREKLQNSRSAAVYSHGPQGRYFLFGADLPQTNCSMIGYVPWDAVAGNVSRIYDLVFTVVSLLLLLFAFASIYLFMVQSRVAENESIRKAKEIADKANQAKSDFLASMSHEIRTPINAVLGMNELILRESQEPFTLSYAKNIAGAGHALRSIINDILDFSKIESGRMELVEAKYHLDSLLFDTVNIIQSRAREKELAFRLEVDSNLPNALYGDAMRIRQIFINLLTNAVKYTPKGSITFSVSGRQLSPGQEGQEGQEILMEVAVSDTGIGIKEEDKPRLFRDFERLDTTKNRNIEGTGLGLAITVNLLKLMGGEIAVESVYGKGSTFRVTFPQKITATVPIGDFSRRMEEKGREHDVYSTSFRAPKARLLVVDDNKVNLLVAKNLLKQTEIQVSTCTSGEECLRRIREEYFDVILLDHMMPDMDGIETLEASRKLADNKCRSTPIIALTANAVSGAREMFLAKGFTDYLSKPINPAKLEQIVQQYLPEELVEKGGRREETRPVEQEPKAEGKPSATCIDTGLGLEYNGGLAELYQEVLSVYRSSKEEKAKRMQDALDRGDWKNYGILVHALKSTSLTIGCRQLSDEAKALEKASKTLQSAEATEEEKKDSLAYIREHHGEVMALYDRVAAEAGELQIGGGA